MAKKRSKAAESLDATLSESDAIDILTSAQGWNSDSLWTLAKGWILRDKKRAEAFVKELRDQASAENSFAADHEDLRRHDALGLNDG